MTEKPDTTKPFLLRRENRYLGFALILPAYLLVFAWVEAVIPVEACRPTYIPLDDRIPFLEGFIVPYMLWFPMLLALGLYLARYDHEGFKRYMTYVGVAFFTVIALYLLFPNRQDLRVTQFPRDNLFTRLVALVYSQDTNTNVCPSLHVVGSMAVCFAAWNCRRLRKPWMQGAIWAFAFLVAVSTVFVKQHSALDLILAVPFSLVVYPVVYRLIFRRSGVESPVRRSASEPAT